jgi:hypothetical protein
MLALCFGLADTPKVLQSRHRGRLCPVKLFFIGFLAFILCQPFVYGDELTILRGIASAPEATMADLCDIITIQRGELEKYPDRAKRCAAVSEQKVYPFAQDDIPLIMPVTAGAASKAAINAHRLEKSLLFSITGLEWYAVQSAEHLGLLRPKTAHQKKLSGAELLAVFENANNQAESQADWQKPKNPYEDFGATSYDELNQAYDKMTDSGKDPEKKQK